MLFNISILISGFLVARAAVTYTDFISRDVYNFCVPPSKFGIIIGVFFLTIPFLCIISGFHHKNSLLFNGFLSFAVSGLVVPAVFANRVGDGFTPLKNMIEKSLLTIVLAFFVVIISAIWQALWWYGILVFIGFMSIRSRAALILLGVQDPAKSDDWNDRIVEKTGEYIRKAKISYFILAVGIGFIVQFSILSVETWNKGGKFIKEFVMPYLKNIGLF